MTKNCCQKLGRTNVPVPMKTTSISHPADKALNAIKNLNNFLEIVGYDLLNKKIANNKIVRTIDAMFN